LHAAHLRDRQAELPGGITNVLRESAPAEIDVDALRSRLVQVDGVIAINDPHAWTSPQACTQLAGTWSSAISRTQGANYTKMARACCSENEAIRFEKLMLDRAAILES
jgi:Co/Zn/Cd efflux system component